MPMMGIPMGVSVGMFSFHQSPMTRAFNSYTLSRAVYFKTLLDPKDLNHVSNELGQSQIQKVQDFVEKYQLSDSNEVIYYHKNMYYIGYYIMKEERIIIVEL
ncbi:MAG: hypothetical protein ACI9AB_000405 [Urechidicola sp.]|jgi:hypothetical protein